MSKQLTHDEMTAWKRYESENGCACGVADALAGLQPTQDVTRSMPIWVVDMPELIAVRQEAYTLGHSSVSKFVMQQFTKKAAEQTVASLKSNGYSVISTTKAKGQYGYVFTITAATDKRIGVHSPLPYGAKIDA